MTVPARVYLAAAAIAIALPATGFAQDVKTPPAGPTTTPSTQAPSQAPSMKDRVAPGGMNSPATSPMRGSSLDAKELKGADVFDKTGNKVGEIDDVMPQSGQPRDAVVSVGGILGIGAKKVLIPASDIAKTDDGRLVVAMSEAQIEELPEFEQPRRPSSPTTSRP